VIAAETVLLSVNNNKIILYFVTAFVSTALFPNMFTPVKLPVLLFSKKGCVRA